ncbi:MAG: hypothetical protein J7L34_06535 [Thermotogaceae bacterium]|nr:hypothetical protein [Thermotogaceae bacterium]
MRRWLILVLVVFVALAAFSKIFVGLESLIFPALEYKPLNVEVFARLDVWSLYLMLPVIRYDEFAGVEFLPFDLERIKRELGAGLALKASIFKDFYARIATDIPLMEWLKLLAEDRPRLHTKFGIGWHPGMLDLEGGIVAQGIYDPEDKILVFDFKTNVYYAAFGLVF